MSSRNGKDSFARVPCSVTGSGQAEHWSFFIYPLHAFFIFSTGL
jgi:hypothetical protein